MNCFVTEGSDADVADADADEEEGKFTFFAITWIRLIGSRQNLAWTYYLTLGTSLRRNFSFFSKSKMTTGGQKSKIGQILPHKSHFLQYLGSGSSDSDKILHGHNTWPFKQACATISHLSQNPRWSLGVHLKKIVLYDLKNDLL